MNCPVHQLAISGDVPPDSGEVAVSSCSTVFFSERKLAHLESICQFSFACVF